LLKNTYSKGKQELQDGTNESNIRYYFVQLVRDFFEKENN